MMRSTMTGLNKLTGLNLVLLVLVSAAAADITVQQTVDNGCTGDLLLQCKTLGTDYGLQTLTPGSSSVMPVTSSLADPDLTCDFSSAVVAALKVKKTFKIWEYLKSGFTDSPQMTCTAGCLWKTQDDGLYYRALDGSFVLLFIWADILPSVTA